MLLSVALIMIFGMLSGELCKKIHLPSLIGMLLSGILLGPYVFDLINSSILDISSQLRKIALIIILMRAGLSLNISDLKKVGRPAVLMCFLPATFEIIGMALLAPKMLGVTLNEALIMGAVVGAVSPAVIVPKMLNLIENNRGTKKSIPQLILAGASVDDVFVIVLFSSFVSLGQGIGFNALSLAKIPFSIVSGVLVGVLLGVILGLIFKKMHIRDTSKLIILLSISFVLSSFEDNFSNVPFSSLISVMSIGIALQNSRKEATVRLSVKFNKLWVGAEIVLFVLVGSAVNINYASKAGFKAVALILAVLVFRALGVVICLIKTNLNVKERLFCVFAYIPKATVQAAIGGVPLALGLSCGDIVLTVAVLSIIITAPLGALLIDIFSKRFLEKD